MANQEGDYVQGKGILMPDGTYRAVKPGDMGDTTGDAVIDSSNTKGDAGKKNSLKFDDLWLQASKTGISRDAFMKLNPVQQTTIATIAETATNIYSSGGTGVTVAGALKAASEDPNIVAKYADSLNLDTAQFTEGLKNIQTAVSTESETNRMQFEKDRKALAEANAAAGTAYSGFRQQAQDNLAKTEAGIVTSSRSRSKTELNQLKQSFAAKWGSAETPGIGVSFGNTPNTDITGRSISNPGAPTDTLLGEAPTMTGTQSAAKQADINAKARELYDVGQLPKL